MERLVVFGPTFLIDNCLRHTVVYLLDGHPERASSATETHDQRIRSLSETGKPNRPANLGEAERH